MPEQSGVTSVDTVWLWLLQIHDYASGCSKWRLGEYIVSDLSVLVDCFAGIVSMMMPEGVLSLDATDQ